MRVAAALHTLGQHLQLRCLLARLKAVRKVDRQKRLAYLEDAPVRWLEFMPRMLKLPSVDHEGGSCPVHPQAAFTTGRLLAEPRAIRDVSR